MSRRCAAGSGGTGAGARGRYGPIKILPPPGVYPYVYTLNYYIIMKMKIYSFFDLYIYLYL